MIWWRIELDSSGAIRTCEQVEANAKNTNHVRFVEASTKAEACSSVKQWYEARRAKENARDRARREAAKAKGLCQACFKQPPATQNLCRACADRRNERQAARRAGEPPLLPRTTPEKLLENRRKCLEASLARNGGRATLTFGALLRKFDALGPEKFRAWLVSEIERRSSGAVASVGQAAGDGV